MKEEVLKVLRDKELSPKEKYEQCRALLRKSPGHNVQVCNYYNRAGYTKSNLKNICYDLQKLHNISNADISEKAIRKSGKEKTKNKKVDVAAKGDNLTASAKDLDVNAEEVTGAKTELKAEDFNDIEQEAAEGLKVRVEFPFLNDDDCPDKLKILVADRITAWNKYKAVHAKILKHESGEAVLTDAELYDIGKEAIDKFELNQLIWDELNYYKDEKEILGAHPIFAEEQLQEKVDAMSDLEADKRKRTLKSYVSRENKKLQAAKTPETKAKIEEKLKEINDELVLVEAKLGAKE